MGWKYSLLGLAAALVIACMPRVIFACAFLPPPLYADPPYIDLVYATREVADKDIASDLRFYLYPWNNFNLLFKNYVQGEIKSEPSDESVPPKAKEATYREAVADLLKSKGIAASAVELSPIPYNGLFYDSNFGGGCTSNTMENALVFLKAAFNDPAVTGSYVELVKIRHNIRALCAFTMQFEADGMKIKSQDDLKASLIQNIDQLKQNGNAGGYPLYLQALVNFYDIDPGNYARYDQPRNYRIDNFQKALAQFSELAEKAPQARWWNKYIGMAPANTWLHQTSLYMVGRIHLIVSQKNWDGMGSPKDKIDLDELEKARTAFQKYLVAYPQGLYAESTKNLNRKLMYLQGDRNGLNAALRLIANDALHQKSFTSDEARQSLIRLREFERYYKGGIEADTDTPLLIAYETLKAQTIPDGIIERMEKRRSDFDGYPGLLRFLRAYILSRQDLVNASSQQEDYQKLVDTTPYEPASNTVVSLSAAALRAHALEKLGRKQGAFEQWKNIAAVAGDDQSQIHLASYYVDQSDFASLFGKDSGIANGHIVSDFAQFDISNEELWKVLDRQDIDTATRATVEQVLFRRLLLQRNYAGLEKLVGMISDLAPYKGSLETIHRLNQNPEDAEAHVLIGKYIYENFLRPEVPVYITYGPFVNGDALYELKSTCPSCQAIEHAAPAFADFLKANEIINRSKIKGDIEAEDLYYLVRCFRGSEFRDRCQWATNEAENHTKEWYTRLHKKYPNSVWAKQTPYYYE